MGTLTAALVAGCAVLGLVVGSFLNVVVHRVPLGLSVVSPGSACPACGTPVRPRDNVPVLGWLLLGGRCRDCGAPISPRYLVVEVFTAVLFGLVAWWTGPAWHLPAYLYLAAIAVALTAIDLDVRRLPDAIVLPAYPVAGVLLLGASVLEGDGGSALRALAGAAGLLALYVTLALLHPGGMGLGDVKLSGVLGAYLAWAGWAELAVGGFLGFLLGGLVGAALMALGRAGRRTRVPFGPFMLAGAGLGLAVGEPLAAAYLALLGL
jgi:leader peptidase (prepilin peptidase) / N-methyltransferase